MFFTRIKRRDILQTVLLVMSVGYILIYWWLQPRIDLVRLATSRHVHSSSTQLLHSRIARRLAAAYNSLLGGDIARVVDLLSQSRDLLDDLGSKRIASSEDVTHNRHTRVYIVVVYQGGECGGVETSSDYLLTVSTVDISSNESDEPDSVVWQRCRLDHTERQVKLPQKCDSECLLNRQLIEGSAGGENGRSLLLLAHQLVSISRRQIQLLIQPFHLLENHRVAAVGGATIDSGQRHLHCWQSRSVAWQLSIRTSPLSARSVSCDECGKWLFCDDVGGPLMINATVWKQVPIPSVPGNADMFTTLRSHFLALKISGFQSITLPEVSLHFQVNSSEYESKELVELSTWSNFVRTWRFSELSLNGKRIPIDFCWCPDSARSMVYHFSVPLCCGRVLSAFLEQLFAEGRRRNLPMELSSGSVLAAVKLFKQLPWDFDVDLRHSYDNVSHWLSILGRSILQKPMYISLPRPQRSGHKEMVWFSYFCHHHSPSGVDVDFWGDHVNLAVPSHGPSVATLVQLGPGSWLEAPANPGKYAREMYGPGCLRHIAHWRALSSGGSRWEDRNSSLVTWPLCPMSSHHACLSVSDIDGSLLYDNILM